MTRHEQSTGPRNNPDAEANIAALLAAWRRIGYPIFHVRHDGTLPTSTYRPGQRGNEFKPEAAPLPGETIIVKHTNSAFIGTEFERLLRQSRIYTLVIMGVITNNSLEATVRMSGNLGFAPMRPPAGSFLGGFRTPAPVPADRSPRAGTRNPSPKLPFRAHKTSAAVSP